MVCIQNVFVFKIERLLILKDHKRDLTIDIDGALGLLGYFVTHRFKRESKLASWPHKGFWDFDDNLLL